MSVALALETLGGGAVDDELIEAVQSLVEAGNQAGPRYEPRVIRILVQLIAARAYGRPLLELAHLLGFAERFGGRHGAAGFFWGIELARGAAFEQSVQNSLDKAGDATVDGCAVSLESTGLRSRYEDGVFLVHFGRMPLLAALYEFLVVTIGYDALTAASVKSRHARASVKGPADCANELSRLLYHYLRDRLPSAQHQRMHRRLINHLTLDRGEAFSIGDIDDAAVLSFWRRTGDQETFDATEVRSFRVVVLAFLRFRRVFQAILDRRSEQQAQSVGTDWKAGEIDLDELRGVLEVIEEETDWLAALAAPPCNAVKFLNKRENERLDLVARHGRQAVALPLSVLRSGVFGDLQGRLTEARRRGRTEAEKVALIEQGPSETYEERLRGLTRIEGHLRNCRLAALHVLARHKCIDAIGVLLDLFPDVDLGNDGEQARTFDGSAGVLPIRMRAILASLAPGDTRAGPEMRLAARGFAAIARQGFSEEAVAEPEHAERFKNALPALAGIARELAAFVSAARSALARQPHDGLMDRDREIFTETFRNLYGGSQ